MSLILGPRGGFTAMVLIDNEDRLQDPYMYNLRTRMPGVKWLFSFYDSWSKPQYQSLFTTGSPKIQDINPYNYSQFKYSQRMGGSQTRVLVQGQCINSTNLPVPGATVQLFDTPSGQLVDTVTADSGGYYSAGSPYSSNVFSIGYLAAQGANNDIAGTTINYIPG